jgi:hypothetical protein
MYEVSGELTVIMITICGAKIIESLALHRNLKEKDLISGN